MARLLVLSVGLLVAAALLLAAVEEPLHVDRELPVGREAKGYRDPGRRSWIDGGDRPLATLLWYPAAPGAVAAEWSSGVWPFELFRFGSSAEGASWHPGRYPLILLSHGTGGSPRQLAWLGEALASQGFVVAAVSHHGNTSDERDPVPHGFYLWWERAADLSRVLDRLLADPEIASAIDPQRIGAAGFSLGGYTVLALAGARLDMERYRQWCAGAGCKGPPEAPVGPEEFRARWSDDEDVAASLARAERSYRDERVRAVVAIAPALGPALDAQSLREIAIPVAIVVGDRDDLAVDGRRIATAVAGARIDVLPGAGHYTFLAPCGRLGRLVLPALCRETEVERSAIHRTVARIATAFFRRSLDVRGADPEAEAPG